MERKHEHLSRTIADEERDVGSGEVALSVIGTSGPGDGIVGGHVKKTLILCGVSLLLTATAASAAGINLSWDNCGTAGTWNKLFACDTNTGSAVLVASVVAPAGIGLWTSFETEILLQSDVAALPDWWRLRNQTGQTGQCRNGALSASQDFTGAPYAGACQDVFLNGGAGGIKTYIVEFGGANRARLAMVFSVPTASQVPLNEGVEYFAARATVLYTKSFGTGSCGGCLDEVWLVCTYVRCLQPAGSPGGNITVTNPAQRYYVYWNRGVTPARSATWGAVKSLYR